MQNEFELHAARAFFASAWADQMEENGHSLRGEIMDQMPSEIDPGAIEYARLLRKRIERDNGKTIAQLMEYIEKHGDGDRPNDLEMFGHYAAMQAMGHGVGLGDAFGYEVRGAIKVPYIEFGMHNLEREYGEA